MFAALRKIGRLTLLLVLGVTLFTATADTAFARKKVKNEDALTKSTGKSYLLPYSLVVLGVALGVIIVARPTFRADQPKRVIDETEEE